MANIFGCFLRKLFALLCLAFIVTAAQAQQTQFNIPPQALDSALLAFSEQANVQVSVSDSAVSGVTTQGISGAFTPETALANLLADTGLSFKAIGERTYSVSKSKADRKVSAGGSDLRLMLATREEAASAVAPPASKASATTEIQEIIVTAQKREERLLDTPISIGVLTGEALDAGTTRDVTDALTQIAGVSLIKGKPGDAIIAVRGVVSGAGTTATGYYLDEIPFSFIRNQQLPDANAYDLARVEVLRGPQGTLYGANALNGVVRILTNDAKLDGFEGKARVRISGTEGGGTDHGADVAVNIPLVEGRLAVRGVAGYGNLSGFIDSRLDGRQDVNDTRAQNYRFKANFQATEALNIKATLGHSIIKNGAPTQSQDDFTTPYSSNQPNKRTVDIYNMTATYGWRAFSLLSSTSYLEFDIRDIVESGTNLRYIDGLNSKSFSEEVRLAADLSDTLKLTTGGIYKDATDKTLQDARPNVSLPGPYNATDTSESIAIFGEATQSLAGGRFQITGGLRYYKEDLGLSQQSDFNPNATLVTPQKQSYDKVTGRALLAYKPSADAMFYTSYSTGFRSGIFQSPATLVQRPELGNVSPDTIANYEAGAKGRLFEGVLSYETAVYFMDWQDVQQGLRLGGTTPTAVRTNAGSASGWGAEGSVIIRATQALSLNISAGWNDLRFDSDVTTFAGSAQSGTTLVLFSKDARVNDSPEWTGHAGVTFRTNTGMRNIDFVASSEVNFGTPRIRRFLSGTLVTQNQSDEITDVSSSIGLDAQRWSLMLFADNVLDENGAIQARSETFINNASRLRPRTIGLQAAYKY